MADNIFSGCNALESLSIPFVGAGRVSGRVSDSSHLLLLGYLFGISSYGGNCTYQNYVNPNTGSELRYCVPISLKSVAVTDTTFIPDNAFVNCTYLTDITVCDQVRNVGYHAVYNTGFFNNHPDGVVYLGKVACGYKGTPTDVVEIKEGTVAIGDYAFFQNTELKNIVLPDTVKIIGEYAFRGCTGLESCTLGEGLQEIRSCGFYECKKLQKIELPHTLTTIGGHTFYNCTSLEGVEIPPSVTTMENWAFALSGVKSVVLSPNVYSIAAYAFYSCSRLEQVYVPRYVYNYGYDSFSKCAALSEVFYVGSLSDRRDHMTSASGNTDFFNASWHYGVCSGTHSYSADCDPTCNSCGWERRVSQAHTYTNACDNYCDDCYDYRATQHVYTDDCDTECNICFATRTVAHFYDNECDAACNACGSTRDVPEHIYLNACDTDCNVCGAVRTVPEHAYVWVVDRAANCGVEGLKHEECTICQAKRNINTGIPATGLHTYEDIKDDICNICEMQRHVIEIAIETLPEKTVYLEGKDQLDVTGGVLAITYDNGTSGTIPMEESMVSGFSNTWAGSQYLTVTYGGCTARFTITIQAKTLTGIVITSLPITTTCLEGKKLDLTGLVVTACYDNDTQKTVTGYTTDGYDSTPGTKTITVTYQGMTTTFEVEVLAKSLTRIAVTSYPVDNTYLEGKEPDFTGLEITAYYNNDTREVVTDYTLSDYASTPGLNEITVIYQGMTTTFYMVGMYKSMCSIAVTSLPDKQVYARGEYFDPTGLVVTAYYDNDTQEELEYYSLTGYDYTPGEKTITVQYGSFTDTFTVWVNHLRGDLDGNGYVNTDDVVALLLYISMPDVFPLGDTPADFTGDGKINTDDAVQLLLHISMPDVFPI